MSKFYTGLFKSDKFRDRVIDARDTYNSTHIESGFMAAKRLMEGTLTSYDKPYIIYDVFMGAGNSEEEDQNAINIPMMGMGEADGLIDCLHLHFHGKLKNFFPPSDSDLLAANTMKNRLKDYFGVKINPIIAVAHYDTKGKSQILAFQEKGDINLAEDSLETIAKFYENKAYADASNVTSDREGYQALKRSSELLEKLDLFNVAIFSCDEKGVPKNIGRKLRNFSSEHKIIPELFNLTSDERNEKFFQQFIDDYHFNEDLDLNYMQMPSEDW